MQNSFVLVIVLKYTIQEKILQKNMLIIKTGCIGCVFTMLYGKNLYFVVKCGLFYFHNDCSVLLHCIIFLPFF